MMPRACIAPGRSPRVAVGIPAACGSAVWPPRGSRPRRVQLDLAKARAGQQVAEMAMSAAAGGSLCLEFTRLSQITGDAKYHDATERIKLFLHAVQPQTKVPGLWPRVLNLRDETADGEVFTLGGGADSLYEYLPKMHALLGGLDPQYEKMAARALDAARDKLLYRPMTPKHDNILMAGSLHWRSDGRSTLTPEAQHLTCFVGGTYGLAGQLLGRREYVDLASRLAVGCVWAYDSFATNIMPETAELVACERVEGPCPFAHEAVQAGGLREDLPAGFLRVRDPRYMLRPEAIESVFYIWRITGDQMWRDAAWRMWQGIVRETETELAFASIDDVTVHSSAKADSMETFWLAETTKYFYLIFEDESVINLDEWGAQHGGASAAAADGEVARRGEGRATTGPRLSPSSSLEKKRRISRT